MSAAIAVNSLVLRYEQTELRRCAAAHDERRVDDCGELCVSHVPTDARSKGRVVSYRDI